MALVHVDISIRGAIVEIATSCKPLARAAQTAVDDKRVNRFNCTIGSHIALFSAHGYNCGERNKIRRGWYTANRFANTRVNTTQNYLKDSINRPPHTRPLARACIETYCVTRAFEQLCNLRIAMRNLFFPFSRAREMETRIHARLTKDALRIFARTIIPERIFYRKKRKRERMFGMVQIGRRDITEPLASLVSAVGSVLINI